MMMAIIAPTFLYGKYIPYPNEMKDENKSQIEIVAKSQEVNVIPVVAKKAMPSVVGITTITVEKDFFSGVRRDQGVGTGVIIDNRGYILTNSHVVNDGKNEEVNVLFHDGKNLKAEVLWNDSVLDLAIVKVDAQNLPTADLGNSEELEVGDLAIAIGNPLGLAFERTVTAGIISGLNRSIEIGEFESIEELIQTDASINPGNSGGPLLNKKGEVIGINTAKIQSGEGLGFAIPINIAKPIVDEFIEKGEFRKVYLGISGINVAQYIRMYADDLGTEKGIFVKVFPNSPVEKAGMKDGDVIVSIDGKEIETMRQLVRDLYKYRPNDKITIEVLRNRKKVQLEVILEERQNK
ncbi:trypsin-like peptidase domain-containing protein [Lutibacter sp. B2]|nr:trypsin-like peptidase domain-containing protein [Lutibacter sp. B2]